MRKTIARCAGLQTSSNIISSAPNPLTGISPGEGSYRVLDNCVVRLPGLIEPRRGQDLLSYAPAHPVDVLAHYLGSVLAHTTSNTLELDTGSAYTAYASTYTAPARSALRMKFATAQRRLYFTTAAGVYRLDGIAGTPMPAGVGRPRIAWNSSRLIGDSLGFLSPNSAVGYRATLTKRDSSTREMTSAPSDRALMRMGTGAAAAAGQVVRASNVITVTTATPHGFRVGDVVAMTPGEAGFAGTGTVTAVTSLFVFTYAEAGANAASASTETFTFATNLYRADMVVLLAADTAAGDILRLWRTDTIAGASAEPGDEVFLAYERVLTSTDISAGSVTIHDYTPDVMLGDAAYFSPSQGGIDVSNEAPPYARDICVFDNRMWFAYAQPKRQFELTVLATGGSLGLAANDTLTISLGATAFTLTAVNDTTADGTAGKFDVFTGGTVSGDNEKTAMSIVSAINSYTGNTIVDAFYVSGFTDNPGRLLIQERLVGSVSAIGVKASAHGSGYVPTLNSSTYVAGTAFDYPNRVYLSKQEEPDAVPPLNFAVVGEADDAIQRVVKLGDAKLFVFKERSTWTITPSGTGTYTVDEYDATLALIGADTAAVMGGNIYCLTKRGPVEITPSGVTELGLPIETDIDALMAYGPNLVTLDPLLPAMKEYAWGLGYETEKMYLCALTTGASYTVPTYCWNGASRVWTRWQMQRSHAVVEPITDLLYMAAAPSAGVFRERKRFNRTDYKDEAVTGTFTILSVAQDADGLTVLTMDTVAGIVAGMLVQKTSSIRGVVKAISGNDLTLWPLPPAMGAFTATTVTIYNAITVSVKLAAEHMGLPGLMKDLQGINLHFQARGFYSAQLTLWTENATTATLMKTLFRRGVYPYPYWEDSATGDGRGPTNEDATPPREQARATYFSFGIALAEAEAQFRLAGWTFTFEANTERTGK